MPANVAELPVMDAADVADVAAKADFVFCAVNMPKAEIKELEEAFQDEAHIIYVNSRKQDDTELGRLMHDLHCKKADEMHSPILAKRVYELKETQKGVELMCHEMEKIYSEGMESGEKRGIEMGELKAKKETILSLAEMGIPVDKIAKAVNLSEKDVQKWIDENLCIMK